ncbi:MAG: T9SS type A sorting domain-containing protein [Rhodothermaceae bacterium]|nr:T9SS type A sorting domain-containing protein [Rhodothermaceae bacterium]
MNAVSFPGKHALSLASLFAFLVVSIAQGLCVNQAFSQQTKAPSTTILGLDKELTQEAKERIASTISSIREEKSRNRVAAEAAAGDNGSAPDRGSDRILNQVDLMYTNTYFDTQENLQYSFPEDSHDFCRAYFGSNIPAADFYLNSTINSGSDLSIELRWSAGAEVTDYDLYLFDSSGKTVGDATGVFPGGSNGVAYQFAGAELVETATVQYNGAGVEDLLLVVDRFRGPGGNTLELMGTVLSGGYDVLEYTLDDVFGYYDAATDERQGTIENNSTIDISMFSSPTPELALVFETDDCTESVQFELINSETGEVISTGIDNDLVYSVFGGTAEDLLGDELPDGMYELTATPYSGDDATGAQGPSLTVSFDVTGSPTDDDTAVTSVILVNAATGDIIQEISDGDVIDVTTLPQDINIRAVLDDTQGLAAGVQFVTAINGVADAQNRDDTAAPYSLFDGTNGDESVPNPTADGQTIPLGAYQLTASPIANGGVDPAQLVPLSVNFDVIGPRIGSFTLINVDTKLPIDGFDPIPEGAIIDLSGGFPTNLNIRANPIDFADPLVIGFVDFTMLRSDNVGVAGVNPTESFRPYSVFGDNASDDVDTGLPDYFVWSSICNETYTLIGAPFSDSNGAYGEGQLTFTITGSGSCTGGQPGGQAMDSAQLLPNFPNPFNPVTTIQFAVPETMDVSLVVYDMTGREVKRLVNDTLTEGFYDITFDAGNLSSGLYMYRLETPESVQYRLMTLLK